MITAAVGLRPKMVVRSTVVVDRGRADALSSLFVVVSLVTLPLPLTEPLAAGTSGLAAGASAGLAGAGSAGAAGVAGLTSVAGLLPLCAIAAEYAPPMSETLSNAIAKAFMVNLPLRRKGATTMPPTLARSVR
jgi:hypothetical protein